MVAGRRRAVGSVAACDLGRVGVDDQRAAIASDGVFVDNDLLHILQAGQFVHQVEQDLFEDGTQSARTRLCLLYTSDAADE